MRVEVSRYVFAPAQIVWDVLTDWERQASWMVDAVTVEVETAHREGEGVVLRVPTRVLAVTVEDRMEVTVWEERARLGVRHLGRIIAGEGMFELHPTDVGTRVLWWEEVETPLGAAGELGASLVAAPYVRHLFGRSLDGLKAECEREARRARVVEEGTG